jgi:RES domain-containing protein
VLIYRLGTRRYPVWDGAGAAARGGRWNPQAVAVIYAAATQSLAMLERLCPAVRRRLQQVLECDVVGHHGFDQQRPSASDIVRLEPEWVSRWIGRNAVWTSRMPCIWRRRWDARVSAVPGLAP